MKLLHLSPVIGLAAITGCGELPEGMDSLEGEQYERVKYLVGIAKESTPIVKEIIGSMDGGWVDADGSTNDPDAMIALVDATQEALDYYWEHGQIYVGSTAEMFASTDAIGAHSPQDITPKDLSDNYIILNADAEDAWSTELIVHESTHCFAAHDATIERELLALGDVSYKNPEVAETIRRHNDPAYMHSGLYAGPANLLIALDVYRDETYASAKARIDTGDMQGVTRNLKDDFAMEDEEEWTTRQAEWITSWSTFYTEFGITTDVLADDFLRQNLYKKEREKRTELVEKLATEIQELRREARESHELTTEHISRK